MEALRSDKTYFLILAFLAASIPLSNVGMSIGTIALLIHVLLRNEWKTRLKLAGQNRALQLLLLLFGIHLIGLLWTNDVSFALNDIKTKLPLLIIPFSVATSPKLSPDRFNRIIQVFVAACFVGTLTSMVVYLNLFGTSYDDVRDISLWISHIRFSLMVAFAGVICLIATIKTRGLLPNLLLFVLATWFVVFLILLKTMAGIVTFGISILVLGCYNIYRRDSSKVLRFLSSGLILLTSFSIVFLLVQLQDFYSIKDSEPRPEDLFSSNGESYIFDYDAELIENGYYVKWYIAPVELEQAWNERSEISYNETDSKGQAIYMTVLRYLTSKGLRKDREGVMALSQQDIEAIESGIANERFLPPRSIDDRVYEIIWEIHNYRHGYNPQGNSVAMRFEYWKTGWSIWMDNFLLGVGTGDSKLEYNQKYDENPHQLMEKYRRRAHNQYLTIALTFGAIGLALFALCLFVPFWTEPNSRTILFVIFFTIYGLSMVTEDSLETQAGVTFFSFFWSILLFARPPHTLLKWSEQ